MGTFRDSDIDSISSLIFSPDPLLRYQYAKVYEARTGPHDPEALGKLMLAVLEDGIACFQTHFLKPSRKNERLSREAEEWIASDSEDPFSFGDVCENLGIDPGWLRRELFRWKERQMKKVAWDSRNFALHKDRSSPRKCRGAQRHHL